MKKYFILAMLFVQIAGAQTPSTAVSSNPITDQSKVDEANTTITTTPISNVMSPPAAVPTSVPVEVMVKKADLKEEKPLSFFGDFRYRHQTEKQGAKDARMIQRIQARLGTTSQVHENLKLTLRLMTGSSANSGNQTLGDEKAPGMPRRSFGLDQAYFEYRPSTSWNLYGGKMPQIFTFVGKNQMILDGDITPEGLGVKFSQSFEGDLDLFVQGGMFWVRENYDSQFGEDLTDNFLNAGQIGLRWKPQDWTVVLGFGTFSYTDLKDNPPANITSGATGNGNTLDFSGNYPTNFDIDEIFIEAKTKVGMVDLTLFLESLTNRDAADLNKAHALGIQAQYEAWNFGFLQKEVQKDAVVGVFTDSDFGGGGTSVRGSIWNLGYKISKKVQVQYSVFKNETAIDLVATNYDRSHLDLMIAF